jgi:hypothetical protein
MQALRQVTDLPRIGMAEPCDEDFVPADTIRVRFLTIMKQSHKKVDGTRVERVRCCLMG